MHSPNPSIRSVIASMLLGATFIPIGSIGATFSSEETASRGPAGSEVDPVTKALYQALEERARSQRDFERNESVGRPKEIGTKKQLRIELGDELGGGVFSNQRRERLTARKAELDRDAEIPSIESKLDAESREVRSQIRNERNENRRNTKSPRRGHWIDD